MIKTNTDIVIKLTQVINSLNETLKSIDQGDKGCIKSFIL